MGQNPGGKIMSAIQKGDFVEVEYTGSIKDTGDVFDTTDNTIAIEHNLDDGYKTFGPVIVCLGENMLLQGVEESLIGSEPGEFDFDVPAEKGFGKKRGDLVQLIPTSKFKKQGINPQPGYQVNIDNSVGVIKTVTGGRTIVDFNHPLSGKDLHYSVKVNRVVTDKAEQIESLLKLKVGFQNLSVSVDENDVATIDLTAQQLKQHLPDEVTQKLKEEVLKVVSVKDVVFKQGVSSSDMPETPATEEEAEKQAEKSEETGTDTQ